MTIDELHKKWWHRLAIVLYVLAFIFSLIIAVTASWVGSESYVPTEYGSGLTIIKEGYYERSYFQFIVVAPLALAGVVIGFWLVRRIYFYVITGDRFFKL